jgi:hypothetical protein
MTRLPKWSDKKAVAKRVADEIEEGRLEIERLWTIYPHGRFSLPRQLLALEELMEAEGARGWPIGDEKGAVEAARRGDMEPLANLLRPLVSPPEFEIPDEVNPKIKYLSPATWSIIADFLTGALNPRTGRVKGRPGRPKLSEEERRAKNRVHDAADEFAVIRDMLRYLYPERCSAEINLSAEYIAQDRARIKTSVLNLRKRRRKTGHRVWGDGGHKTP